MFLNYLTYGYINLGDVDKGLEFARLTLEVLEAQEERSLPCYIKSETLRLTVLNNLAFALYLADSEDFEQMEDLVQQTYQAMPWEKSIRATYGAVQITSGNCELGINMLEQLVAEPREVSRQSRAQTLASLAIGYQKAGRLSEMEETIAKVKALDSNCVLLKRLS